MALRFVAAAALARSLVASGSSIYLAEKCRGGTCTDPKFPLLDFDIDKGECVCRAHPCWNNNGVSHTCSDIYGFPYLHFIYGEDRALSCSCSSVPQYDSLHVSRDMCAGEFCESPEFPVLDWDAKEKKCLCRAHPCWDQSGERHSCPDPQFPILHFRMDVDERGQSQPKCECVAKLEKPSTGAQMVQRVVAEFLLATLIRSPCANHQCSSCVAPDVRLVRDGARSGPVYDTGAPSRMRSMSSISRGARAGRGPNRLVTTNVASTNPSRMRAMRGHSRPHRVVDPAWPCDLGCRGDPADGLGHGCSGHPAYRACRSGAAHMPLARRSRPLGRR